MLVVMYILFITFRASDLDARGAASVNTLSWWAPDKTGLSILGISLFAVKPDQMLEQAPKNVDPFRSLTLVEW